MILLGLSGTVPYVSLATLCQKKRPPILKKEVIPVPFEVWHIDFWGPHTPSAEKNSYLFVAVEAATGWVEIYPMKDKLSDTVAVLIFQKLVCRFGCPKAFVTDNDNSF